MDDPRLTPARPDLAAKFLESQVRADRYAEGTSFEVLASVASVCREPSNDSPLETQALKGERVTIYDRRDGWAWGQLEADKYVGWLPETTLSAPGLAATHKVIAARTFAFPGPSIKLPPVEILSLGARVAVIRDDEIFSVTAHGYYIHAAHLVPVFEHDGDWVAVAERLIGTPYLWGGKSAFGIDCSGLVQLSLAAAGVGALRDSDMQEKTLGKTLDDLAPDDLQRGDALFWKGHVAIATGSGMMIHANAHHMCVVIEPIDEAIKRIEGSGGGQPTRLARVVMQA